MAKGKKKLLFVGRGASGGNQPADGGEYGARRVLSMVQHSMRQENIDYLFLKKPNTVKRMMNMAFRQSYGHTPQAAAQLNQLLHLNYDAAFFNGSIYGDYVKSVCGKKIKTVVFYHNVETVFYRQKYLSSLLMRDYFMYLYIKHNERICTKYADCIITLNERDSRDLQQLYGRKADCCLPTSYPSADIRKIQSAGQKGYFLFVGGNFFANVEGITSFILHALPYLNITLWVAGDCCEALAKNRQVTSNPKVVLKGFLENIEQAYIDAKAVICPIYSGSGMKTKTVEALKYGKAVFATPEAFEGISGDFNKIGGLCKNNSAFISAIRSWLAVDSPPFNRYSYEIFEKHFSNAVVFQRFNEFLHQII
ncbi:hypothetical protein Sgly_1513 [Syntrophobotulus glycolicus DSM 8271]|uniref:Glycosyl transferase group 1 n=1 Tax=Syntrophobotulus glycolicus (strain DSM 8271 / FlGlyR) TaxID=645991 RepID=F0SX31_SYNGF|nr:glycosyltransferase [Syntrophobotulus glycolicus]ADY55814.1 hypothetical protein Sgly_1513 [Syntrophobotulus glycolicus DSM 8271]